MDKQNYQYRYLKYKSKYSNLKTSTSQRLQNLQKGGNRKGLMVQGPMGSGKSFYVQNRVPEEFADQIVDGDVLLKSKNIKNLNFFWYNDAKKLERQKIIDAFEEELQKGMIILYSGSPILIKTDVIIIPDSKIRWQRLQTRLDFKPSRKQFEREQRTYEEARNSIPIVFNSDLPEFSVLQAIRDQK